MNNQKIILINLSKGKLGEENSSFFGAMFLTKIKQAGMARALLPMEQRKTVYVYADEFQNIVTETFENLLSEARKFGLAMIMAHQYVGQLIPKVQSAIFGNVGSMIVFRVSGEDAVKLKPELAPIAKIKDMINLGRREFYTKLLIDGESYDPFSAETLDVMPPNHDSYREIIVKASREKYSKTLEEVLAEIKKEEGMETESTETVNLPAENAEVESQNNSMAQEEKIVSGEGDGIEDLDEEPLI